MRQCWHWHCVFCSNLQQALGFTVLMQERSFRLPELLYLG